MRRTLALVVAMGMSACNGRVPTTESTDSSGEDGGAWPAPPMGLNLDVPRLFAGLPARVSVDGITPGADTLLAAAKQRFGGGWCPPQLDGGCLDLEDPGWELGAKTSPASSTRFTITLPEDMVGERVCIQAAAHVSRARLPTTISDVVCVDVLDALADSDEDAIPDHADPFPDDAGLPGRFSDPAVLALESTTLWSVDTDTLELTELTDLWNADGEAPLVHTDIAIDR